MSADGTADVAASAVEDVKTELSAARGRDPGRHGVDQTAQHDPLVAGPSLCRIVADGGGLIALRADGADPLVHDRALRRMMFAGTGRTVEKRDVVARREDEIEPVAQEGVFPLRAILEVGQ